LVTTTCYIISGDECSKKKKIRGNKKGQVPRTLKERKSETRCKNDKCPTVELGVQNIHLRGKKKEEHLILPRKVSKEQGRYVSPQKSKSRIRLSPLLSPSSPYTIHSPHMHILI